MKHRIGTLTVVIAAAAAGCATGPVGQIVGPAPSMPNAIDVSELQLDSILYVGVELGVAGSTVGGHYDGLAKVYQWPVRLSADVERSWSDWVRQNGTELLISAGYPVKQASRMFARSESYDGVGFVLAGQLAQIEMNTYGALAGNKTAAALAIDWEVLDVGSRNVVYAERTTAAATTSGTSGDAFIQAFRSAFAKVLASSAFVDAFGASQRISADSIIAAIDWRRPVPASSDLIQLDHQDFNAPAGIDPYENAAPAVVSIRGTRSLGTAFIITRDGLALTNHHVIDGQSSIRAVLRDRSEQVVRVVRADESADVALIQLACPVDCPTVRLGLRPQLAIGQDVLLIGTPLSEELSHTLTRGILSGRRLSGGVTLLQTDAAANPGNSGGPMLKAESGEVVGIVSSKITGVEVEGLGFAISIDDALRVLGVVVPQ